MTDRPDTSTLYRLHEPAFRTQYAELKERCASAGALLPGTPGRLVLREGTGYGYWYRGYYAAPGQDVEDFVCKAGDDAAVDEARQGIAFATWVAEQVRHLRKLQFQVADKAVARVLVELRNESLFDHGLVVVGTLGYMAWLNELGVRSVISRTQDVDLACRQDLKLGAPVSFARILEVTKLQFVPVPGFPSSSPSTSFKRRGVEGLRIDVLTHGNTLGKVVPVSELEWHAQAVPHYDYLLREPREAALLAGGHCVPVYLPMPERFVWHKLYSSAAAKRPPEKADKDLLQAATLAAVLVEHDDVDLSKTLRDAPAAFASRAKTRLPALRRVLANHQQALDQFELALSA